MKNTLSSRPLQRSVYFYNYPHVGTPSLLRVVSGGNALWNGARLIERRNSNVFTINLIVSGSLHLVQNGREYEAGKRQCILCHRDGHHAFCCGSTGFAAKRYVQLSGPLLADILLSYGLDNRSVVTPLDFHATNRCMKSILAVLREKPSGAPHLLSVQAFELLSLLGSSLKRRLPSRLQNCIDYIQRRFAETISLDTICADCGISSSHCNRLFKEWLQTTPMEYLATQRMNYALLLLEETPISIKEITFACGYSDPLYFSSRFRKRIGCSPREYRRNLRS